MASRCRFIDVKRIAYNSTILDEHHGSPWIFAHLPSPSAPPVQSIPCMHASAEKNEATGSHMMKRRPSSVYLLRGVLVKRTIRNMQSTHWSFCLSQTADWDREWGALMMHDVLSLSVADVAQVPSVIRLCLVLPGPTSCSLLAGPRQLCGRVIATVTYKTSSYKEVSIRVDRSTCESTHQLHDDPGGSITEAPRSARASLSVRP